MTATDISVIWEQAKPLAMWPVEAAAFPTVGLSLGQPKLLSKEMRGGDYMELTGPTPCDWLRIDHLDSADGELENWVGAELSTTGTLAPHQFEGASVTPVMMSLMNHGDQESVTKRLGLAQVVAYEGFGTFLFNGAYVISHMYIVLMKGKSESWKVCLGMESACIPDAPAEAILSNDHVRAQQVFGNLAILEPRDKK